MDKVYGIKPIMDQSISSGNYLFFLVLKHFYFVTDVFSYGK